MSENILMLFGTGVVANSIYSILIAFPLFCFIYQAIVLAEENYLQQKFGTQYETYTQSVNR
jgi:protein-S-isoprenylcysteine O-methyltransferase Ste14